MGLSMTAPEREYQRGTEKSRKTSTVKNSAGRSSAFKGLNSGLKTSSVIRVLENNQFFYMKEENQYRKPNRNMEMKENRKSIIHNIDETDRKKLQKKVEESVKEAWPFRRTQMDSIKEEEDILSKDLEISRNKSRLGIKEIRQKKERIKKVLLQRRKQRNSSTKKESVQNHQTNIKTSTLKEKIDQQVNQSFLPIQTFRAEFGKKKYSEKVQRRPRNLIPF